MDVAVAIFVRQSQISNWLNGRCFPNFHSLYELADYFGITTDDFYRE